MDKIPTVAGVSRVLRKKLASNNGLLRRNQKFRCPSPRLPSGRFWWRHSDGGCHLHITSVGVFASGKARERRK
jgi:hypothetical protein